MCPDEIQLCRLPWTEIRFTEYAWEQAQQELARAAQFPRAAISEAEDHRVRYRPGFHRPRRFSILILPLLL